VILSLWTSKPHATSMITSIEIFLSRLVNWRLVQQSELGLIYHECFP
jgi:hypothetical protein